MAQSESVTVALYARVSTTDQDCAMQISELREYCSRRGWTLFWEYVDRGWSGRRADRPELLRLMADAAKRKFGAVLVWKLDRFGRSVLDLTQNISKLKSSDVRFIAISQAIDTGEGGPGSTLMLHILSAIAEFETELVRERVKAGLEEARRSGTRSGNSIGRPAKVFRKDEALRLRAEGVSIREIARRLHVGRGTIERACPKSSFSKPPKG